MSNPPVDRVTEPVIRRIQPLSDQVINQIAAGEVLDRPASAVKELIENSLDAGATQIEISLYDGGISKIIVVDNGHGICRDDLTVAVQRHTTSKLSTFDDLSSLSSFGFRGEALASLSSVARVTLQSCTASDTVGAKIFVDQGVVSKPQPVASPIGTRIVIHELFATLPARRKFLKTAATEFSHAARVVRTLAAAHPGTRFFLSHQDRCTAQYVATDLQSRFFECFRAKAMPLTISQSHSDISVTALLSPLDFRSERTDLWVYINGRFIQHRAIVASIRQAYQTVLGSGHEPYGALFLELPPSSIDPNVHPQKLEVRVQKEQAIYSWLNTTVRRALEAARAERSTYQQPVTTYDLVSDHSCVSQPADNEYVVTDHSAPCWWFADRAGVLVVDRAAVSQFCFAAQWDEQYRQNGKIDSLSIKQSVVTVSERLYGVLTNHKALWHTVGFDLDAFGLRDILLRSVPLMLARCSLDSMFECLETNLVALCPDRVVDNGQFIASLGAILARLAPIPSSCEGLPQTIQTAMRDVDPTIFNWRTRSGQRVAVYWDRQAICRWFEATET